MRGANLNTVILGVLTAILTALLLWNGKTTMTSSEKIAVIAVAVERLEHSIKDAVFRREYEQDAERMRIEINAWRARMSSIEANQARIELEIAKLKQSIKIN